MSPSIRISRGVGPYPNECTDCSIIALADEISNVKVNAQRKNLASHPLRYESTFVPTTVLQHSIRNQVDVQQTPQCVPTTVHQVMVHPKMAQQTVDLGGSTLLA